MANGAVDRLLGLQAADGGFGAYPGGASRTEATALAGLALHRASEPATAEAADAAFRWLRESQLESGAWPLQPGFLEPHWSSSMAVMALSYDAGSREAVDRGTGWLLDEKGAGPSWWTRFLVRMSGRPQAVSLDRNLVGWPWASGTFSWVEPTSYALIALKRVRGSITDGRLADRVDEGDRVLIDRACVDGGWNYGNPRVLGEILWPYPDTTAAALLALFDRGDHPAVRSGLEAIPSMLEENGSTLALAMCRLASGAHDEALADVRDRLTRRVEDWEHGEIRALAWAGLALDERVDPLELAS